MVPVRVARAKNCCDGVVVGVGRDLGRYVIFGGWWRRTSQSSIFIVRSSLGRRDDKMLFYYSEL